LAALCHECADSIDKRNVTAPDKVVVNEEELDAHEAFAMDAEGYDVPLK
jgi:hypothetical protein